MIPARGTPVNSSKITETQSSVGKSTNLAKIK